MTEEEAKRWLHTRWPDRMGLLERFVTLLREESKQQSLIARSTFDRIWVRHIVDSAQLVDYAPPTGLWVDVGSGGGLPGIPIAAIRDSPMLLIEPRKLRAAFLARAVSTLGLTNVTVLASRAEGATAIAAVVTARAVAAVGAIFEMTEHIVSRETTYVLQRGRNGVADLEIVRATWHGSFHVKQSLTNSNSTIIIASGVGGR